MVMAGLLFDTWVAEVTPGSPRKLYFKLEQGIRGMAPSAFFLSQVILLSGFSLINVLGLDEACRVISSTTVLELKNSSAR